MASLTKRTLAFSGAIALTAALLSTSALAGSMQSGAPVSNKPAVNTAVKTTTFLDELQLTNAQKAKIKEIRAERTREINAVLNPGQRTKYEQARQSHQKLSQTLKELNLTPKQSKDVLAILRKSNAEIRAALTPEQQKKLDNYLKQQGNSPAAVQ